MKTTNYILFILCILATTLVFAQVTVDQKAEALKIIAKQMNIAVKDVEKELQKDAVDIKVQAIVDDVVERIRRQKVDEAKFGVVAEQEIDDALEAKFNAVSTISVGP